MLPLLLILSLVVVPIFIHPAILISLLFHVLPTSLRQPLHRPDIQQQQLCRHTIRHRITHHTTPNRSGFIIVHLRRCFISMHYVLRYTLVVITPPYILALDLLSVPRCAFFNTLLCPLSESPSADVAVGFGGRDCGYGRVEPEKLVRDVEGYLRGF